MAGQPWHADPGVNSLLAVFEAAWSVVGRYAYALMRTSEINFGAISRPGSRAWSRAVSTIMASLSGGPFFGFSTKS